MLFTELQLNPTAYALRRLRPAPRFGNAIRLPHTSELLQNKNAQWETYPAIEPYKTHRIQVSKRHNLYVAEFGNPDGIPALFLHGGPGAGAPPSSAQLFDPKAYRIILVDQRGAGRSTPKAELRENTTRHLVQDLETVRKKLKISQWLVSGNSWGSTLACAYAEAHPKRVSGLVVGGIFLGRKEEIRWLHQGGIGTLFPELWESFIRAVLPEKHHPKQLLRAYFEAMNHPNLSVRDQAVVAWNRFENALLRAKPDFNPAENRDRACAFIECHYALNNYFLKPNELMKNIRRLKDIPTWIIQGRLDWLCPFDNAWQLFKALPNAKLWEVEGAGHDDIGKFNAFTMATDEFKQRHAANDS